jgi:hypothetical protein
LIVSGFLISPNDQDLIFSGLAMEILILSNCWVALTGPNRLINSLMNILQ